MKVSYAQCKTEQQSGAERRPHVRVRARNHIDGGAGALVRFAVRFSIARRRDRESPDNRGVIP